MSRKHRIGPRQHELLLHVARSELEGEPQTVWLSHKRRKAFSRATERRLRSRGLLAKGSFKGSSSSYFFVAGEARNQYLYQARVEIMRDKAVERLTQRKDEAAIQLGEAKRGWDSLAESVTSGDVINEGVVVAAFRRYQRAKGTFARVKEQRITAREAFQPDREVVLGELVALKLEGNGS